jgi:RNA polymerase sigma-70 factor (ECF subfamily)
VEDHELLQAWRAGDREAGTQLFRRHVDMIFRFFHSKLSLDIEDLVQRTFLACVEAGDRLDELRSFKAYLLGIARKQLLRHFEGQQRGARFRDFAEVSVDELAGPSRVVLEREEHRLLFAALRRLPIDLQITLELFYWEHLPMIDIASVTGVPEGTVKSRLHRAKRLLRERMGEIEASVEKVASTFDDLERWAQSLRDQLVQEPDSGD